MRYLNFLSENSIGYRLVRKFGQLLSFTQYKVRQLLYTRHLPKITRNLSAVAETVGDKGVFIGSIDALNMGDTEKLKSQLEQARTYLNEKDQKKDNDFGYESGFEHCVPIEPAEIASKFPYLFHWGLNENILDFMENLIGLPVAYHGVVVRKELINEDIVGSRRWHIDSEDRNIIRVLIYMTDVLDEAGGPFEYIPMDISPSYRHFKHEDSSNITDQRMSEFVDSSKWEQVLGPEGTVIIGRVAKMFHRGHLPLKPRQVASYYYTSRQPTNEELTMEFSFKAGIPYIDSRDLNQRQLDCLWKYQPLLGTEL